MAEYRAPLKPNHHFTPVGLQKLDMVVYKWWLQKLL
jgi:hypothetical protein